MTNATTGHPVSVVLRLAPGQLGSGVILWGRCGAPPIATAYDRESGPTATAARSDDAVVRISIREGFFDIPVWDCRGQSPPSWSFRAGEVPDNAGASDAVFLVDPEGSR